MTDLIGGEERRRSPRKVDAYPAQLIAAPEQMLPTGTAIDLSESGVLVCLPETSVPLRDGETVVITLGDAGARIHLLGEVRRHVRGEDERFYLALEFQQLHSEDEEQLRRMVRQQAETPEAERSLSADVRRSEG
ncbi:MAG: PilZ domain [Acidimicrobiia bacterium]|nr:PilZ domain [Acidimicrobiia bacterium]